MQDNTSMLNEVKLRGTTTDYSTTKYGVAYDLPRSPYFCYRNGYCYYFSCARHLDTFRVQVSNFEGYINSSLSRRFGFAFSGNTVMADMVLYKRTETRGFYVKKMGTEREYTSPMQITFEIGVHHAS